MNKNYIFCLIKHIKHELINDQKHFEYIICEIEKEIVVGI